MSTNMQDHAALESIRSERDKMAISEKAAFSQEDSEPSVSNSTRGLRYWAIIVALCVTSSLAALEGTVVSTALPSIVRDLQGGESYTWVVNAYFVSSIAFQPLYGQTANIFGRRWLTITAVALFMLGSGISGGAVNMAMLIAGRTIQGIGGGGCSMMLYLIISDLVPVRERGTVMSYIFAAATVCTAMGPFIGGSFVEASAWRWVFYLNLPIAGFSLVLLFMFLRVEYQRGETLYQRFRRIDFAGNTLFITATVSLIIALANAGAIHPWGSWRTILPLVLGFIGMGLFCVYESSGLCKEPILPPHLFTNRTSAVGFGLTFLQTMLLYWEIYFLPVYFQSVQGSSPMRSGVQLLPSVLNMMFWSGVGGVLMGKAGRYVPIHICAFALMSTGFGLFTVLKESSSTAEWVIFQLVFSAGAGLPIGTLLPSVQAKLKEEDAASATGTWAVLRGFGTVWGVTIAAAIFNNQFARAADHISNPATRVVLSNGHAYEYATSNFLSSLDSDPTLQNQVKDAYSVSLRMTWEVAAALAGAGFLLALLQRSVTLRTTIETKYGISSAEKPEDMTKAQE